MFTATRCRGGGDVVMTRWLARILSDTNSRFWRAYELASSSALVVLFLGVLVFLFGDNPEFMWIVKFVIPAIAIITFVDVLKYRLTGNTKDKPLRKWFSLRWAQRYKPEETLILPDGFTGEVTHLTFVRCGKCGAFHGFSSEEEESERICSFRRCKELVSCSDEYARRASEKLRKKEGRSTILGEVRSAPFRLLYLYSWTVSEHTFKLFSWMLISCGTLAAGRHLKNYVIEYVGISLCVLWAISFVVICFRAMTLVQDKMIEWSKEGKENRIIRRSIAFATSMALAIFLSQMIPIVLNIFSEIYSNIALF